MPNLLHQILGSKAATIVGSVMAAAVSLDYKSTAKVRIANAVISVCE